MADEQVALTKFQLACEVEVEWDASEIAKQLSPLQVLQLVQDLDSEMNDWSFSEMAYRFFAKMRESNPDDLAVSDDHLISELSGDEVSEVEGE